MKLESPDGKIKALFLPPDSSSLILPMNQGPVAYLKRKYRTNLLRSSALDESFLKTFSVKSAIYSLANLWRELPEELLCASWHKLRTNMDVKYEYEKIELRTNMDVKYEYEKIDMNEVRSLCYFLYSFQSDWLFR